MASTADFNRWTLRVERRPTVDLDAYSRCTEVQVESVSGIGVYVGARSSLPAATESRLTAEGLVRGNTAELAAGIAATPSGGCPVFFRSARLRV